MIRRPPISPLHAPLFPYPPLFRSERLWIGPGFEREPEAWMEPALAKVVRRSVDARGLPVTDGWHPGTALPMPVERREGVTVRSGWIREILARSLEGGRLEEGDIVRLLDRKSTRLNSSH